MVEQHNTRVRCANLLRLLACMACAAPCANALTANDSARAERFASDDFAQLLLHSVEFQTWLPDGKLAYRTRGADGDEFILVDPAHGTRRPLFDKLQLAVALAEATGEKFDPGHLPLKTFELSDDASIVSFDVGSKRWSCLTQGGRCFLTPESDANGTPSPDNKRVAFIRDYNVWVRDVASGQEMRLTADGVKDFGYATDNPGWAPSRKAVVTWSPDSRKLATYQADQRGLRDNYLVKTEGEQGQPVQPELETWKYAIPGDQAIATIQRVIIDVDTHRVIRLQSPPDPYRSSGALWSMKVQTNNEMADVQWSPDGSQLAFVSTARDHKVAQLRVANAGTGEVRNVFEERVTTGYYSSRLGGISSGRTSNWRYLPASNAVLWFSSRDNWAHLYLYNLGTGKLEHQITHGEWDISDVLAVDEKQREIYFLGVGRERGRHPYFIHFYKVGFDGNGLTLLTPENATHDVSLAPSGEYFVDTYSTPDTPPVTVLRDRDGRKMNVIERGDASRLVATGWKPPSEITVKARDGVTDLYGLMYRPSNFDERRKYPIVDFVYPGPFLGSVFSWEFSVNHDTAVVGDAQAFAELGFVVVAINGMGTPPRSQAFRQFAYGHLGDATLPDQVAGVKELARRYPWVDIDRAGIMGQSAGGYAATRGMLLYPDFFKVGVSVSGYTDPRTSFDQWGEMYMGLLKRMPDGTSNYDDDGNETNVKNLKGHLLLIQGSIDANVVPSQAMLMVDALVKADKDFDFLMLPNQRHTLSGDARSYARRRSCEYFIRYLLGTEPIGEFAARSSSMAAN